MRFCPRFRSFLFSRFSSHFPLACSFIARVERNTILKRQLIVWQRQIRRKFAKMLIISPLYGIPRNRFYSEFKYTHTHKFTQLLYASASEMASVFTNLASRTLHWNSGWKMLKFNWKHGHTTKKARRTHKSSTECSNISACHILTFRVLFCLFLLHSVLHLVVIKRFFPASYLYNVCERLCLRLFQAFFISFTNGQLLFISFVFSCELMNIFFGCSRL